MTGPSFQRSMIVSLVSLGLLVAGLVYAVVIVVPQLQAIHQNIDDHRASLIVTQQEQKNLASLSKNIADIKQEQEMLASSIWSFAAEDQFFAQWPTLAAAQNVIIDSPKIAEATPVNHPVERPMTIQITGQTTNVMATLSAIQKIKPLVAILKTTIRNGPLAGQIITTIEAQSLWQ